KDEGYVQAAGKRLVEVGMAEERVKALPPLQVVLLDEKRQFEMWRDGTAKWTMLPYWQAEAGKVGEATPPPGDPNPFGPLVSATAKVRRAQARLEQRIALLRHVEALRLYAAEHEGKLPAQLSDVKVPLPVDPFTGKPFIYKLEGATATLKGTPPRGEEANAVYNARYDATTKT